MAYSYCRTYEAKWDYLKDWLYEKRETADIEFQEGLDLAIQLMERLDGSHYIQSMEGACYLAPQDE